MPVIRTPAKQPAWLRWSAFGMAEIHHASELEPHFHDADEYWLVFGGRARVRSEGVVHELNPGDILVTRAGDEHDLLEITEAPLRCFWIEDELTGRRRPGHLHHPEDD